MRSCGCCPGAGAASRVAGRGSGAGSDGGAWGFFINGFGWVASGDQLLIRRNGTSGSGSKLLNGELVEVREIAPTGFITLRDGRTILSTFRHLLHGYVVSSQSSQGKTVDRVLVAIDAMSATSAATQATLYVAASRGRESCTLFTDDKDFLAHAFQRSSERRAALEFIQSQNYKRCH